MPKRVLLQLSDNEVEIVINFVKTNLSKDKTFWTTPTKEIFVKSRSLFIPEKPIYYLSNKGRVIDRDQAIVLYAKFQKALAEFNKTAPYSSKPKEDLGKEWSRIQNMEGAKNRLAFSEQMIKIVKELYIRR